MSVSNGPGIVTDGLVFHYDMGNTKKSWRGAPITNSQWNSGNEISPWTVNGINTDVSATVGLTAPIPEAKTWEFRKTGGSDQWNGWESTYGGIWTGSSGDYWSTSYWYKTLAPAGHTGFGIGGYVTSNWSRNYNVTLIDNVSSIIPDGKWHYNYTIVRFNEDYSNAICADGPSWGYSSQPGILYLNGLCWNKNSYAAPYAAGTRSNSQAIVDLTGNNTITANSLTYSNDNTFSFNGSNSYLGIPNKTLGNGNVAWSVSAWVKTTSGNDGLGINSILSNQSGGPVYSAMCVNSGKIAYWTYHGGWYQSLGTRTINDGNWHLLTWVNYTNYTMDMYVDGILDTSVANSTSGNNNPVDRIGGSWAGYFPGSISTVCIYDKALSASEVKQNFSALRSRYGI